MPRCGVPGRRVRAHLFVVQACVSPAKSSISGASNSGRVGGSVAFLHLNIHVRSLYVQLLLRQCDINVTHTHASCAAMSKQHVPRLSQEQAGAESPLGSPYACIEDATHEG